MSRNTPLEWSRVCELSGLPLPSVQPPNLYAKVLDVPKGERLYFTQTDICARVLHGAFHDEAFSTGSRRAVIQRFEASDLIDPVQCGRSVMCGKAGCVLVIRGCATADMLETLTKSRLAFLGELRQRLADMKADPLVERLRRLAIPEYRPYGLVTRISEDLGCSRENVSQFVNHGDVRRGPGL